MRRLHVLGRRELALLVGGEEKLPTPEQLPLPRLQLECEEAAIPEGFGAVEDGVMLRTLQDFCFYTEGACVSAFIGGVGAAPAPPAVAAAVAVTRVVYWSVDRSASLLPPHTPRCPPPKKTDGTPAPIEALDDKFKTKVIGFGTVLPRDYRPKLKGTWVRASLHARAVCE